MFYSNNYVAFLGGINCDELNCLEIEFLQILNWDLVVEPEEYAKYTHLLDQEFSHPLSGEVQEIIRQI